ncbi:hypothetical protein M8J75_013842 [Diaphorina citri]|nr:hypothetical protein M8J75_013842 [Diaphorina citri]KAI5721666.1 hypothetical protein M8J77_023646 [Diaphorina citri]
MGTFKCVHCKELIRQELLILHCKECDCVSRPDATYNYVCFACKHHSNVRTNMLYHIRTHTGENPFKCSFCPYKCKGIPHLKQHIQRKHLS